MQKQKERNSKNKNENKQFFNSDLHDFFSTNRLFGKTDKHLTECLTVPSCLFVCFVSCKFFLGHFSFFSFAGWVLKWGLGWAAPACGHSKGLRSQISFLLNIYTHERCVCICAPAAFDLLLQHEPDCLPSCIQVFEFDLNFHCFCSCNTATRQLHWNEHFAFWLVPVLLLFSAYRLRQISSTLFSYSSLCLSSALNCSAACQKMLALSNLSHWMCFSTPL